MARLPRLVIPHQAHYVIQRGLDQQALFRDADDHRAMLGWLRDGSRKFRIAIHAYALLPHAWCLLVTPADEEGLGRMMQWVGRYYVPYFNHKYGRSGTLWQGRFKAAVIDAQQYLIDCTRFIETTQVEEVGLGRAADYRWSSHSHHSGIAPDPLVTEHALFWALGNTPFDREAAYRLLAQIPLPATQSAAFQTLTEKCWALGSAKFLQEMEKQAGRRVEPAGRGRPSKKTLGDKMAQKTIKLAKTAP